MIYNISGNDFLDFCSLYHEPINLDTHHLVCRRQLVHTKSVDQLLCFPCEAYIELTQGIAAILIGSSPRLEDLKLFPIHYYLKIKPDTYFNLIALSNTATYNLMTPSIHPSMIALPVPYLYRPFAPSFHVLEIFDCYVTEVAQYHFQCPAHNDYELLYVNDGTLTINFGQTKHSLAAHDLIICGPDEHYPRQISTDTACTYLTVVFHMHNTEKNHFLSHVFSCPPALQSTMNNLIAQSTSTSYYAQMLMLCYLQEAIAQLMQLSDSQIQAQSIGLQQNFHRDLLKQILSYMNQNVTEPITVEEICRKFFISRSSLQVLFKAHLHTSPKNYLINIKLQKGKELIQENRHTISEIAYLLGFSSIHYFSRLFKKYFNISPSEYAKQATDVKKSETDHSDAD